MNLMLASNSTLPLWLVLPMGAATMYVIARHVVAMQRSEMPASRRRIRTANGLLMIFVTALLGYALGVMPAGPTSAAPFAEIRAFVMVWGVIIGLMPIVIGLGVLDAANNVRLHMNASRGLRQQFGGQIAGDLVILAGQRRGVGGVVAGASLPDDASVSERREG